MKKHPKSLEIPQPVVDEMERLVTVSPLLSPTLGWPKVKGLEVIQTRIQVGVRAKGDFREPLLDAGTSPETLAESSRVMAAIQSKVLGLLGGALKSCGWKLRFADRSGSHHHCALWRRNGLEIATVGYVGRARLLGTWIGGEDGRAQDGCYSAELGLSLVGGKGSDPALREAAAALGRRLTPPRLTAGRRGPTRPEDILRFACTAVEVADEILGDMPEIHVHRSTPLDKLPAQHQRLLEQAMGKVRVVDSPPKAELRKSGILTPGLGGIRYRENNSWCSVSDLRQPGSIRLMGFEQGMVKWTETFGPGETVPAPVLKRLLAGHRPINLAPTSEQRGLILSIRHRAVQPKLT